MMQTVPARETPPTNAAAAVQLRALMQKPTSGGPASMPALEFKVSRATAELTSRLLSATWDMMVHRAVMTPLSKKGYTITKAMIHPVEGSMKAPAAANP